jgi:hypothetical protein
MGILTQHITTEPEPVAQRAAKAGRQLPPGLAEVITRCLQKTPAQRFSTMDELVGVLIQIYRGLVGPGMSTYMEAFPVQPSAAHPIQPTPPPRTGPVMVPHTGPQAATVAAPGTGPYAVPVSGSSGVYPGAQPAQRGKLGLIIAILVVLAVGGAIAAFVVVGNKAPGPGGSGSQVAIGSGSQSTSGSQGASGSQGGHIATPPDAGPTSSQDGSGSAGHIGSAAASGDGSAAIPDKGSNTPPPVEVVEVPLFSRSVGSFQVYENGIKVLDGPDNLEVPLNSERTVEIRARGFKDKTLVVQGVKKRVQFALERLPHGTTGTGGTTGGFTTGTTGTTGGTTGTTGGTTDSGSHPSVVNCTNVLVDPKSAACVKQYCAAHPNDFAKCLE